jgi:hypothetical protein
MEMTLGLPLLAGLLYALSVVRKIARRERLRRLQLRRSIGARAPFTFSKPAPSARSEMHAYDDPTTVMEQIRTTTSPARSTRAHKSRTKRR